MGVIFDFLGERVAAVDLARNMGDLDGIAGVCLSSLVFAEVDVLGAFVRDGGGPVDGGLVVVVNGGADVGFRHSEVGGSVFDVENFVDAFGGGLDFGFAGAKGGLVLASRLPGDGAAATANDIAGKGSEFEDF